MVPLKTSRRNSRRSSPAVRASSAAASPQVRLQSTIDETPSLGQTSLDSWLEPPLRLATSYEDAGMDKSALFENMQPLGTLPNAAKLKYKPHNRTTDKRPPFRTWGENAVSTPELTPPVEMKPVEESNGAVLPPSRAESVEKEAFPPLIGTHTEEPDASTPPLAHDEPSTPTLSPQSPVRNDVPVVTAVGTPASMSTQELPTQNTSTPQQLPATQNGQLDHIFSPARPVMTEKAFADAVYNANQRAQEAGSEHLGEAILGLWQLAKQPTELVLHDVLEAVFFQRATKEQDHLFGVALKEQRSVAKRKLRTHVQNTRPSSMTSTQPNKSPEPLQPFASIIPPIPAAPTSTAPTTPIISSNPPNPPMGNFHTTPSRPVTKAASLLRTPRQDTAKPKLQIPATPPLQPSPRITSRKSSNAVPPESPAVLGKRRRGEKVDASTPDIAEESTPRAKRRAISNATKEIESTQSDESKINAAAARLTRSRRSLGTFEQPESSPKSVPQTPPARTRSGLRRQSSSDLSSVDEEVVNEGPPVPVVAGIKRTAAEVALDEAVEERRRRRSRFDSEQATKKTDWESIPQDSNIRSPAHAPKEQTLKINVTQGRTTRSGAQRRSQRDEESAAPLTPALPSPRAEGLIPGASRATRSSQSFSNAEQLLGKKPKTGARFKTS
jgi:hypothetical protein